MQIIDHESVDLGEGHMIVVAILHQVIGQGADLFIAVDGVETSAPIDCSAECMRGLRERERVLFTIRRDV